MGFPLSQIIVNIFMKELETKAFNTATLKAKLWLRYVDNTWFDHKDDNT